MNKRRYPRPGLWYPRFEFELRIIYREGAEPVHLHNLRYWDYLKLAPGSPILVVETYSEMRPCKRKDVDPHADEIVHISFLIGEKLHRTEWKVDPCWVHYNHRVAPTHEPTGDWGDWWMEIT